MRLANAIDWRGKSVLMHASYVPPRATIQFQPRHLPRAALARFLFVLLSLRSSRNHAEMAKLLIEQKARVDAADYTGGATALMLAARNGSLAAVTTLIEAGAKVSASTPQGTTVLMQGVANGSAPIVGALLMAGAAPNARDRSGASALTVAASTGNSAVVQAVGSVGGGAGCRGRATTPLSNACRRTPSRICPSFLRRATYDACGLYGPSCRVGRGTPRGD